MLKKYKGNLASWVMLVTILFGALVTSFVFVKGQGAYAAPSNTTDASAEAITAPLVHMHTATMRNISRVATTSSKHLTRSRMPLLTGVTSAVYAHLKTEAVYNSHAPFDPHAIQHVHTKNNSQTPPTISQFNGMADSPSICPPSGCEPPDMALAASPQWVFQGVNTAFAVYSPDGTLQSGWPKNAQSFFGIPNPGNCDPNGPFETDPRAFYDPVDGRFWTAMLQVQGSFVDHCPLLSLYWIAVSQTGDPNGAWNIYAFDMTLGTTNVADYTQFGFDSRAVYFSVNMYNASFNQFKYAQLLAANKSLMEAGTPVTAQGFRKLKVGKTFVDTVQPVETEATGNQAPGAELLISSFNINSGGGLCHNGCSGLIVWAFANALGKNPALTHVNVSTPTYLLAPQADEPGCSQCIETIDTRISGTPVYQAGFISFALETGVNNGSQVVPGIFWGEVQPGLNKYGKITSAMLLQSGLVDFTGDQAASFGCTMPDVNGNLLMVFDTMSSSLNPSIMYTTRKASDPPGTFGQFNFLVKGLQPTNNSRWGDFEATSYDGANSNHVWFASEYAGGNQDWASFIGETILT